MKGIPVSTMIVAVSSLALTRLHPVADEHIPEKILELLHHQKSAAAVALPEPSA